MGMSTLPFLLMYLLAGGASDLLDAVPSDIYWESKGVVVTAETLTRELARPPAAGDLSKIIDAFGSDDPAIRADAAEKARAAGPAAIEQLEESAKSDNPQIAGLSRKVLIQLKTGDKAGAVRRLMAIRTAGEKKLAALLPRLKELAADDDYFTADYAAAAIAAIEEKPFTRKHEASGDDVWLLPDGVRMAAHLSFTGGQVPLAGDFMAMMTGTGQEADPNVAPDIAAERRKSLQEAMRQILDVAEKLGNVRIDGITVGLAGDIGPDSGYVVMIFHGRYDARAALEVMRGFQPDRAKSTNVNGVDGLTVGGDGVFLFPDNTRLAYIDGPNQNKHAPLDAIAGALRTGNQPLKGVPEMVKLIGQVDTKAPVWGAMQVTDAYRAEDFFRGLQWITLTSAPKDKGVTFRFEAQAVNAAEMASAVTKVDAELNKARERMKRRPENGRGPAAMQPVMDSVSKLVESARCKVDDNDPTRAHLTGELEVPPTTLLSTMLLGM